jgi:hypothetical protein
MAPNHSFIQVKDAAGRLYNYEATRGVFISDALVLMSDYVKAPAIKNRMYLDTLTVSQTLASCVIDLANGYIDRYGYDDFVDACITLAVRFYPHGAAPNMLASNAAWHCFGEALRASGNPPKQQIVHYPELQRRLVEAQRRQQRVVALGHEDIPPDRYATWLQGVEEEKNRQDSQRLSNQFRHTIPSN